MSVGELDQDLLKNWPAFCKFAQNAIHSSKSLQDSLPIDNSVWSSSIILSMINNQRLPLYEEFGFDIETSQKLDELIYKIEEFCLLNIINLYDTFKLQYQVGYMSSCTVDLKRISFLQDQLHQKNRVKTSRGNNNLKGGCNVAVTNKDVRNENSGLEMMGRGKRKKFTKVKFDFSHDELPVHKLNVIPKVLTKTSKRVNSTQYVRKSLAPKRQEFKQKFPKKDILGTKARKQNVITKQKSESAHLESSRIHKPENEGLDEKIEFLTPVVQLSNDAVVQMGSMDLEMSVDASEERDMSSGDKEIAESIVKGPDHIKRSPCNKLCSENCQSGADELVHDDAQTNQVVSKDLGEVKRENDNVEKISEESSLLKKEVETGDLENDLDKKENLGNCSENNNKALSRRRKGRGPQRQPKKFPWNLVPIVCSMCKMRYSTYSTLRRHWTKSHTSDKKFDRANPPNLLLCQVCDKTFSSPRTFLKHYRVHAAEQDLNFEKFQLAKFVGERSDFSCDKLAPITCSICKLVMVGDGVIYNHWKTKHRTEGQKKPPPLFYCDQCGQCFDAPRKFKLHYRIHTGAKPHSCDRCQKSFRTFSDLTSHMLCHDQTKEFKCSICNKGFIAQKILNRHMKGHLSPCVCNICGKSYPSKYSLNLHTKIHTGEKPHKCEFCGVAFTQAGSLKLHRRIHLGEKPHVCETCGMRFNSFSHLQTHRRVHTGEKPYKCDKCSYAAASSSRLKDHATVHKDEKPHVCKVPGCGRRYKRLSHLIFHHSKHPGVKPYVCKNCGMSFKLSSALTLHKRQDACALRVEHDVKEEMSDPQLPKQSETISFLVSPSGAPSEDDVSSKEQHAVLIYQDDKDDLQLSEGATHHIAIMDPTTQEAETSAAGVQGEFEQQIVIQIVREPGQEDDDIVLSKEELEKIVRLSQQI